MIQLHDYQSALVDRVREAFRRVNRVLLVSPCGSGKTVIFSYLSERAASRRKRTDILAHRSELLDQIGGTLEMFHVEHSFVASDLPYWRNRPVQVCSVFTMIKRLERMVPPDLLIIDEAHHAAKGTTWSKILHRYPNAKILGVTASPERLSGEGLRDSFDEIVLGPSVRELIDGGYLADYKLFAPPGINTDGLHTRMGDFIKGELSSRADKRSITGHAVDHYRKHCDGLPAVAFCVSVNHARHVAGQFREAGYRAVAIDGKLDRTLRREIINDFRLGKINVLASCDLISEGFDVPGIHAAILLRPTKSLALYIQQTGRALRTAPGKETAIILDHAGNSQYHGLPDDDREWSLDGASVRKNATADNGPGIRTCPKCFAAMNITISTCIHCGFKFPEPEGRKVEVEDGDLEEVDKEAVRRSRARENKLARTIDELTALGLQRGYKNPEKWARYVFDGRVAKRDKMRHGY